MSDRPRLLDLFACEGGAARGYAEAGFDVVGVDVKPQPHYPYEFWQMDVRGIDPKEVRVCSLHKGLSWSFDAVHASPPCQVFTELNSDRSRHVNLIPHTRRLLRATGLSYVIENVRGAAGHLVEPVSLFGTMFDDHMVTSTGQRFNLSRERCFETNWGLRAPSNHLAVDPLASNYPLANVYGGHLRARSGEYRTGNGTGRTVDFEGEDRPALARQLMGMPWATMAGMSQAVPPSYTRFIGEQLMRTIR